MVSLVLGTVQFGVEYGINNQHGRQSTQAVGEILSLAWKNGITQLDTAQNYGEAEKVLRACLESSNSHFTIHSKFILSDKSIQQAVNVSLENLGIDKLGYFYFHRFADYQKLKNENALPMHLENTLGLAVSAYSDDEIRACIGDPHIKAIQVALNLLDSSAEKMKLLKELRQDGKKIFVRSVFLQGLFFMDPNNLKGNLVGLRDPLLKIHGIAEKYGVTMKELSLGYVKSMSDIEGILIGVDTKEQLMENLEAWPLDLKPEIIAEIKNIQVSERHLLLPMNWKQS
jgi:aryl-alcohol dehydrogenase-like predicted oxidoreductase